MLSRLEVIVRTNTLTNRTSNALRYATPVGNKWPWRLDTDGEVRWLGLLACNHLKLYDDQVT